jgi:hypothetical protein
MGRWELGEVQQQKTKIMHAFLSHKKKLIKNDLGTKQFFFDCLKSTVQDCLIMLSIISHILLNLPNLLNLRILLNIMLVHLSHQKG